MSDVRLVLSDVDGTLVSPTKELTPDAVAAVARLRQRDVHFALTSGRPPRGMAMLVDPLNVTTPIAAFNGGLVVDRAMRALRELPLGDDAVATVIDTLQEHEISVWVFQGTEWYVLDAAGPHVAHEADVCAFDPLVLPDFTNVRGGVVKVVGVSDDVERIAAAQAALVRGLADEVSATTSQSYYLDVTHRDANKGGVVDYLAEAYDLEPQQIAVIGDMSNDLLMFERAGLRIAMGNGSPEVQAAADVVTRSNAENGFAYALEHYVLT